MADRDYVIMLRESLEQKVHILQSIIIRNREQKNILNDPNATPDEFEANVNRKGELIDKLNALDDGFEQLYERVRLIFETDKRLYADEIHTMQDLIREITDLSAAIRKMEQENRRLAERKFSSIRSKAKEVRKSQAAVNSYYKSMMNSSYVDPQFVDRKK